MALHYERYDSTISQNGVVLNDDLTLEAGFTMTVACICQQQRTLMNAAWGGAGIYNAAANYLLATALQ